MSAMDVNGFHAHVYYDSDTFDQAEALCHAARERFGLAMGRMHRQPVGPHPSWSCQLTIPLAQFQQIIPWLMQARAGLTVFVHGVSGDALRDHTELVLWLGDSQPLNLEIFRR